MPEAAALMCPRHPREIQRNQRAEQMSAVDRAQPVRDQKIEDNAHPQGVGHPESGGIDDGKPFKSEQRIGRQNERPYFLQVGIGEPEGLHHRANVGAALGQRLVGHRGSRRRQPPRPLPKCGLGFDVCE